MNREDFQTEEEYQKWYHDWFTIGEVVKFVVYCGWRKIRSYNLPSWCPPPDRFSVLFDRIEYEWHIPCRNPKARRWWLVHPREMKVPSWAPKSSRIYQNGWE